MEELRRENMSWCDDCHGFGKEVKVYVDDRFYIPELMMVSFRRLCLTHAKARGLLGKHRETMLVKAKF